MKEMTDPMMRCLYGPHAIEIPINIIVQPCQEHGRVMGIFQSCAGLPLMFGSTMTHQLIMGDAVIRPRAVLHSNGFAGMGLSGMMRDAWLDTERWMQGGVIINPAGDMPKRR